MAVEIRPQPGPQDTALRSKADILIYGGQAGGGKTWFLCAEPLRRIHNPLFRGVIFRRTSPQITGGGGIWEEANLLYRPQGAKMREGAEMDARFPSGAAIEFCHLQLEKDKYSHQGKQYCCEVGTKIRTKRGLVPVESIVEGDLVETLSGYHQVMLTQKPRLAECVEARIGDNIQVQTTDHAILTTEGWLSYDDMFYGSRRPLTFEPTLSDAACKSEQQSCGQSCTASRSGDNRSSDHSPKNEQAQLSLDRQDVLVASSFSPQSLQDTDCEVCGGSNQESQQLPLLSCLAVLYEPAKQLSSLSSSERSGCNDASCVQHGTLLEDCQGGCSSLLRQCGEQHHFALEVGQSYLPQQVGVEQRNPNCLRLGDSGNTQICTRQLEQYVHPYTMETLDSLCSVVDCICEMKPCGKRLVVDITVANVSHYVSESGLINKNCYIGFDELTHFTETQFFYLLSRNRSTCGIKPYVRATCNPDAGSWVATFISWWIGEDGLPIQERTGLLRYFVRLEDDTLDWGDSAEELSGRHPHIPTEEILSVTFVPATLADNKILMQKDPGYKAKLMSMPRVERERLLGGNWRVSEGSIIDLEWLSRRWTLDSGNFVIPFQGNVYRVPMAKTRRYATVDTAGTSKEKAALAKQGKQPSNSACLVFDHLPSWTFQYEGRQETLRNLIFLRHVYASKVDWPKLKVDIPELLKVWNVQRTWVENAHHGQPLLDEIKCCPKELVGPVIPGMGDTSAGAKLERAVASGMLSRIEFGQIFLPHDHHDWMPGYVRELSTWTGLPDEPADMIDVTSYACYVTKASSSQSWGGVIPHGQQGQKAYGKI